METAQLTVRCNGSKELIIRSTQFPTGRTNKFKTRFPCRHFFNGFNSAISYRSLHKNSRTMAKKQQRQIKTTWREDEPILFLCWPSHWRSVSPSTRNEYNGLGGCRECALELHFGWLCPSKSDWWTISSSSLTLFASFSPLINRTRYIAQVGTPSRSDPWRARKFVDCSRWTAVAEAEQGCS